MKIASYNVMSGGFDSYTKTSTAPQRLPLLQEAVRKLDVDIIGLIDTFRWDKIYAEAEIAKLFNYKYAYCINLNDERLRLSGHNNGITLLSNIKLIEMRTIRLATRDAIMARIQNDSTKFYLITVYLDDLSEDTRVRQLDSLRSFIDLEEPLLIMGDLNTIKRGDINYTESVLDQFYRQNPEVVRRLKPVIDDMLRGKVIEKLESWGLRDAGYEKFLPTLPTPLFPAKIQQPFLRLDYCFHTPSLSVDEFSVSYDETFQKASDHFPISFDIT